MLLKNSASTWPSLWLSKFKKKVENFQLINGLKLKPQFWSNWQLTFIRFSIHKSSKTCRFFQKKFWNLSRKFSKLNPESNWAKTVEVKFATSAKILKIQYSRIFRHNFLYKINGSYDVSCFWDLTGNGGIWIWERTDCECLLCRFAMREHAIYSRLAALYHCAIIKSLQTRTSDGPYSLYGINPQFLLVHG